MYVARQPTWATCAAARKTPTRSPVLGACQVHLRPVATWRHQQGSGSSNHVTGPPAAPPPSPPRREARNEVKPPAAFRIAASAAQFRHPRPAPIGDLDPDNAVHRLDRDRDRPARSTRAGYAGHYCRKARSPAGRPHPRTGARDRAPRPRTRGRPAPAPPARPASRSPEPPAQPSAHPPSRPPAPREITRAAGRTHGMHARLGGTRQARTRPGAARPWPSVESRRCTPTVLAPESRPLCVRGHRNTAALQRYKVTHDGTEKKRPASTRIRS